MEYTMDTISRLVMGQKESLYFQNPRVALVRNVSRQRETRVLKNCSDVHARSRQAHHPRQPGDSRSEQAHIQVDQSGERHFSSTRVSH